MDEIYELYELKEMLMKELKEYGEKGEMNQSILDMVDKLTHALKNLCKIIDDMEGTSYGRNWTIREGYSNERDGYSRNRAYDRDERSYRKRDSMGRFSRDADVQGMMDDVQDLMSHAKDEKTRQEFRRFMSTLERM